MDSNTQDLKVLELLGRISTDPRTTKISEVDVQRGQTYDTMGEIRFLVTVVTLGSQDTYLRNVTPRLAKKVLAELCNVEGLDCVIDGDRVRFFSDASNNTKNIIATLALGL